MIISGVLREIENTLPTWFFTGDYFLFAQKETQSPRSNDLEHSVIDGSARLSNKFKAITFVDRLENPHPTVNMAWKWKLAYSLLLPYIEKYNYQRFVITRPDFYFIKYKDWDSGYFQQDTLYSTSNILIDSLGHKFFNDAWFVCDLPVFKKLSEFYDYYEPISNTLNIHVHLSNYIEENGIRINDGLITFANSFPLRPNSRQMFSNGILQDKYTVNDLILRGQQWKSAGDQDA